MTLLDNEHDLIWQRLAVDSDNYEHSMDKLHRKQTGSYFTSLDLTYSMMKELVESLPSNVRKKLYNKTFLEPCVGTGNFVFAYLRVCRELNFSNENFIELLNNIYVCDINKSATEIYCKNLKLVALSWFGIALDDNYFKTHIGSGLLFDVDSNNIRYIPIEEIFDLDATRKGFDIVVTNPPYKNLKAERVHYQSEEQKNNDKQKYLQIGNLSNQYFSYSTFGTLNLYKLFVEEITERYLSPTGICSLLIPSSILSDKSCTKLRTRLLDRYSIKSIRLIPENSNYVDASQALCAVLLQKGEGTKEILIDNAFNGDINQGTYTTIDSIIDDSTGNAILILSENEYRVRNLMKNHPVIKDIRYINNLRGELDITLNKASIIEDETSYRLYRGRHIGYFKTIELPEKEFVSNDFVKNTTKQQYIHHTRLACQQIVNMAKKRRISFTLVPSNSVLANSCNFISIQPNQDNVDLYFLMGILNSELIDWYFKLTSSNNHINNYEIDNFPIPISYKHKHEISKLVQEYLDNGNEDVLVKINELVYDAYGISKGSKDNEEYDIEDNLFNNQSIFESQTATVNEFFCSLSHIISNISIEECESILCGKSSALGLCVEKNIMLTPFEKKVLECIEKKYLNIYNGKILNHTTFKLSDLDMEMITPIPQGGSWKDIPLETAKKSKRLSRITQTGGRTTLYGRIDYSKPSYTITTYFNRPGNGTYVHPIHNRVISVREAARFQCFPDDYMFCGNKTDMLNQVGNAVPVLLAYSIAKNIREKTGCSTSVDLFSGAGGMTYGFKRAGVNAVIANDFSESACVTLKTNCPEIPVLCGDITEETTKQTIINAGINANADIICGGPPCQGFSLAGYRMKDDPRNQLFRHFVDIVSVVKPKVIVFENVEGLLSYQNGETYRNIIELFSELGYNTEGRKLSTNNYGVPQRRKRVIILCTRKDIGVLPSEIFPKEITPNEDSQITAYETIFDLEQVVCSENARYNSSYESEFTQYLKHKLSIDTYLNKIQDNGEKINTSENTLEYESVFIDNKKPVQLSLFDLI